MGTQQETSGQNSPSVDGTADGPTHIVGVGASAGGLEALERLFEQMPMETGLAFVVVQHLSPDFKSLTDDILARKTRIPIQRVVDGVEVRANVIYLLPPKKDMIVSGGKLLLTDKDPSQALALPIDHFFRSLANDLRARAIAVVLSGTGSDGSRGIRDVREAGGLVIVQDPDTAKFDGMPRSAIDTGVVDVALAPEAIPDALLRHCRHPSARPMPDVSPPVGVEAIFQLLRDAYGIDFSHYKPDTVGRRLDRRLSLGNAIGIDDYAQRLAGDPAELNQLYRDLLIGVTRFFRDPEAFDELRKKVLPMLLQRLGPDEEFRAWVAGCATGEEAYSLAMAIRECQEEIGSTAPVKVFATDAHRASLDVAGLGAYPEASVAEVGPERLRRFFVRTASGWQVSADLRQIVVFAAHNVLKDAPFTRLDLVACRNLLIYFQPPAQKRVLSLFHFGLKTSGVLFLGPSETPGEVSDEFETMDSRWKLYRKRRDVRLANDLRLGAPMPGLFPRPTAGVSTGSAPNPSLTAAYDSLLDEFMPPSLLVSDRGEVLQAFAGASRYMKIRDGRITNDLLDVVDPEMRMALTGALPRVFREMAQVSYKGLRVNLADGERLVNVTVRPVRGRRSGATHALVRIEDAGMPLPRPEATDVIDLGQASREQVLSLESELRYTKENLQAMIEEMETSNEELQATNQELVAANEELQSTNEELHSVNEELYTVNGEYQKKISELTELTADMDNVLSSCEVHTIFLDRELRIRKFTPKIAETFNLLPQDLGRKIDHFTHSIEHADLLAEIRMVLSSGDPIERTVRDRRGRSFLLKTLPYRTGGAIDGVVLTLIDITELKRSEDANRFKDEQLAGILRNSPYWVFMKDLKGRYTIADDAFKRAIGCDPVGKTAYDIFPREVAERLAEGDEQVLADGRDHQAEVVIPLADGDHTYLATKFPVRDEAGDIVGIGGIKTDVTSIREAERSAREALAQRDRFLAMLSHELRNPLAAVINAVGMANRDAEGANSWLRVIERRARHMSRLLDDLLDLARLTQNRIEMRRTVFDLGETQEGALEEVRPWFTDRNLKLVHRRSKEPLHIEGDPARLHQVQVNLLMNAAKYTPSGGTVDYEAALDRGEAVVRVRDTGVGLSSDMLERIFEPFVQADDSLNRADSGIGVGLTLVRTIVEMHGGSVVAASGGPGKGSEFTVRLPLAPAPAESGRQESAPAPPPCGGLRVLLVEDDADIRTSLSELLAMDGHHVTAAEDAEAALQKLQNGPGDIAFVDVGIPGMNGYELARAIHRRYDGTAPYLVALTGYGRPEDRAESERAGFDLHLTKPCRFHEINAALASAHQRAAARTEKASADSQSRT